MSPTSTPIAEKTKPTPMKRLTKTRFVARWSWRGIKAVALLLLLVVIIGSGWIAWTNHRGQNAAEEIQHLIAERGLQIDESDLIPDNDNGARLYLAAAKLLILDDELEPLAPVFGQGDWPLFGDQITAEQTQILKEKVETNRAAFDIIRQARQYDLFCYSFNGPQAFDQFSGDIGRLRRTARWIGINLYLASAEKDSAEVVESLLDMLHLCYSMDQGSSVLAQMVRVSILALAQGSIEEVLSRMSLSDESLVILSDAVRQSMRPHVLASALEVEASLIANATGQPDVRVAQVGYDEAKINRWMREISNLPFSEPSMPWWYGPTWRWQQAFRTICPGSQQLIDTQVAKFNLDVADTLRATGTIDHHLIREAAEAGADYTSGLSGTYQNLLKNDASLLSLIYALEAERFRLKMGRWPNDFAELLDGDPVPVDPWNQPLRLLHTDQGIRVYSVGINAIDDRGIGPWHDGSRSEQADDWGTELLNPDQRGLVPEPISESEESEDFGGYGEFGDYSNGY